MNAQQQPNPTDAPTAKPPRTESAYLAQQADEASAALGAAFAALKRDLAGGVDPQAWAKQYPWVAVGAAAVAGFAAASVLVPSKEAQALKKLERIERALHPHLAPASSETERGAAPKAGEPRSLASRIFSEVFTTLKPALTSVLAAYAGHAAATNPDHTNGDGNGHAAGSAAYYQETDPNQP